MMKKYRLAIIGTGSISSSHYRAIQALAKRVELLAAVDINEAAVTKFCAENAIPNYYTNSSEMLAIEKPDLVCVTTSPDSHKALCIECMEAGAWVYCEKPLCASLAEFDEIQASEASTGCFTSTVFQWRFGSAVKHLKHLIEQEALGRSLLAVCHTLWYRTQDYYETAWRRMTNQADFAGPTVNLGIHLMDLLLFLLGDWADLRALTGTLDRDIESEDVAMALVHFQNGTMGSIINSALSPRQETHLRIDFQKATVEVNALYSYSNEHWKFSTAPELEDSETLALWDALNEDFSGSHTQQLRELLDSMDKKQRPHLSGDEARRIIEFIASIYKSASTGQTVYRGEITPSDPFYYHNYIATDDS